MFFRYLLSLPILLIVLTTAVNASPNFCSEQLSHEQSKDAKPIFCQDFQHRETGLYTSKKLNEDWPNLQSLSNKVNYRDLGVSQERVNIVALENKEETNDKTKNNRNQLLKIKYPESYFGPWQSGATWIMKFPKKYQQLSLEYKVMFKEGFLYDREGLFGGKLPGLMGGETISGGGIADGKNGWTSRLMWGQKGRGLGYLYYPDMRDDKYNQNACPRYGLDHELCVIKRNKYFTFDDDSSKKCLSEWASEAHEFKFKTERFYKIKQLIKMNTLPVSSPEEKNEATDMAKQGSLQGKRDGQLKIWLDDKLVVDCNNIRYRDVPELAIDSLLFSTFFGGNTPENSAHPHDEFIYFDDFVVREN